MKKIVLIGAGSYVFTRHIVNDLLSFPAFSDCTLALVDISQHNLDIAQKVVAKVMEERKSPVRVIATTDRKEVMEGADGVICTIQVGSYKQFLADFEIPIRCGINLAVGDTRGPSAIFRFLRTAPVLMDICRDIEQYCPDAIFCNYANPMSLLCKIMQVETKAKVVGLCHSVQGTIELLAKWIDVPVSELSYLCAGINHQAWFLDIKRHGREDVYPLIREAVKNPDIYNQEQVRNEMFIHLGHYVTESSGHNSEYNWWFRKRPELIEKFCLHGTGWGPGVPINLELAFSAKSRERKDQDFQEWFDKPLDLQQSKEYASSIFNAVFGDNTLYEFNGNVLNNGLVDNLPAGSCVEVPIIASKRGMDPIHVGKLPLQLAALNAVNCTCDDLAVEGAITGDPVKILHAITYDPLTAAVLSLEEIRNMVREMFAASEEWLPQFKHKI
jgi:alpha-galactosidase